LNVCVQAEKLTGSHSQEEQMHKTARELVAGFGECVNEYETVLEGARKLADLGVESLPICDEDLVVLGTLSERDVVRVVAERRDPDAIRVGLLVEGRPDSLATGPMVVPA
jgi:predicted transcriptional regulator